MRSTSRSISCQQVGWQCSAVAGPALLQSVQKIQPQRVDVINTLDGQQPLDAVAVGGAFALQAAALARQPPDILLFSAGRPDDRAGPWLAALMRHDRAQQHLDIEPIGLGASPAPVDRQARRVQHQNHQGTLHKNPIEPEPVAASFVA
jgi:hypothetical protein